MIPSTILGLVLFIVLLVPGFAYVLRSERRIPVAQQSAFRETIRIVFASVACLTVIGLALALLRWRYPSLTPDVGGLVRDPAAARDNYVSLAWWSFAGLLAATALGAVAADGGRNVRS